MLVYGSHSMPTSRPCSAARSHSPAKPRRRLVDAAVVRTDRLEVADARTRRPSRRPAPRCARHRAACSPSTAHQPSTTSASDTTTPCSVEHGPDVGGERVLRRGAGARTRRRTGRSRPSPPRRRSDAFVEVAEPRPAEVRPDEIGKAQLAGVAHVGQRGTMIRSTGCDGGQPSVRRSSRTVGGRPRTPRHRRGPPRGRRCRSGRRRWSPPTLPLPSCS